MTFVQYWGRAQYIFSIRSIESTIYDKTQGQESYVVEFWKCPSAYHFSTMIQIVPFP